mgnify:CR=1 FL=1
MNRENKSIIAGFKPNTVMFLFSLIYFVSYLTRINYAAVISEIITEGLTGKTGGKLKEICDICVCVPETETFKVQELHLPVYHYLCARVEKELF